MDTKALIAIACSERASAPWDPVAPGQEATERVRKGMGLLGSLVSLESLIAGSDGARRPAIIPADHPSIVATSVLGEGVSATVVAVENLENRERMAVKLYSKLDAFNLQLMSDEVAMMLSLQSTCERIPPNIRLSAWQKSAQSGPVTVLPLRAPFVQLQALSAHLCVHHHKCDETSDLCSKEMVRFCPDDDPDGDAGLPDDNPTLVPRPFWGFDGFYVERYTSSAQDLVNRLRRKGRPVGDLTGLRLISGSLLGLALMERDNYVHADFKLDNVLVQADAAACMQCDPSKRCLAYPSFTTEERVYTTSLPPVAIGDFGHTYPPWDGGRAYNPRDPRMTPGYRSPELCQADLDYVGAVARGLPPRPSGLTVSSGIDAYAAGVAFSQMFTPDADLWPYTRSLRKKTERGARGTGNASGDRPCTSRPLSSPIVSIAQLLTTSDPARRPAARTAHALSRDVLADLVLHSALRRRDDKARGVVRSRKAWDRKCGLMAKAELAVLAHAALNSNALGDANDRAVAAAGWASRDACLSHEACGVLFVGCAWPSHDYREDLDLRGAQHVQAKAEAGAGSPPDAPTAIAEDHVRGCVSDGGLDEPEAPGRVTFGGYIGDEERTDKGGRVKASHCAPRCTYEGGNRQDSPALSSSHRTRADSGRLIRSNPGEVPPAPTSNGRPGLVGFYTGILAAASLGDLVVVTRAVAAVSAVKKKAAEAVLPMAESGTAASATSVARPLLQRMRRAVCAAAPHADGGAAGSDDVGRGQIKASQNRAARTDAPAQQVSECRPKRPSMFARLLQKVIRCRGTEVRG